MIQRSLVAATLVLLLFSSGLRAATPPDQLIQQTVERLIDELTERKAELEHDRGQRRALETSGVRPRGRQGWRLPGVRWHGRSH